LKTPDIIGIPIADAVKAQKLVDPKGGLVRTGKSIGICFGDD